MKKNPGHTKYMLCDSLASGRHQARGTAVGSEVPDLSPRFWLMQVCSQPPLGTCVSATSPCGVGAGAWPLPFSLGLPLPASLPFTSTFPFPLSPVSPFKALPLITSLPLPLFPRVSPLPLSPLGVVIATANGTRNCLRLSSDDARQMNVTKPPQKGQNATA